MNMNMKTEKENLLQDLVPYMEKIYNDIPEGTVKQIENPDYEISVYKTKNIIEADLVMKEHPEDKEEGHTEKDKENNNDHKPTDTEHHDTDSWMGMTIPEFKKKYSGDEKLSCSEYDRLTPEYQSAYDAAKLEKWLHVDPHPFHMVEEVPVAYRDFIPLLDLKSDWVLAFPPSDPVQVNYNKELRNLCDQLSEGVYSKAVALYPIINDDTINNLSERLYKNEITHDDFVQFKKAVNLAKTITH